MMTSNASQPEGRANNAPDPAQPTPPAQNATTVAGITKAPELSLPFNEAQAKVMLEYLAARHGLPQLKLRVTYSRMLKLSQPSAMVEPENASSIGLNSDMLVRHFFGDLHGVYGMNTNFDGEGMQCQSAQDLANMISISLLRTPLNTRDKVADYLREKGVLSIADDRQLKLALPEPEAPAMETRAQTIGPETAPAVTVTEIQPAPAPETARLR